MVSVSRNYYYTNHENMASRLQCRRSVVSGPSRAWELTLHDNGFKRVAGVDEVGRGPLAGPVVVAAVLLPRDFVAFPTDVPIHDSKRLTPRRLVRAYTAIMNTPGVEVAWAVGDPRRIDATDILATTFECMVASVRALPGGTPDAVLVDGNMVPPGMPGYTEAVVKGDSSVLAIACASIVAKVRRDRLMCQYHHTWPVYGFDRHKGYGTRQHMAALTSHGPCPIHRRSFNPLRSMLTVQGAQPPPHHHTQTRRCVRS